MKSKPWAKTGKGQNIVVIGAGISGLCTAYHLKKCGFSPIVVEASDRPGGRIYTDRSSFHPQYAELGATRIPDLCKLTISYCREFGLELIPFPAGKNQQLYIDGKIFDHSSVPSSREILDRVDSFYESALRKMRDEEPLAVSKRQFADSLNQMSEHDMFVELGATQSDLKFAEVVTGSEYFKFNARTAVDIFNWWKSIGKFLAIKGGNDQLITNFQRDLHENIRYKSKVIGIVEIAEGVKIELDDKDNAEIHGDYAFITLPPKCLKEIKFAPELGPEHNGSIESCEMEQLTNIFLQFKRRFWVEKGVSGLVIAYLDKVVEHVWDVSSVQEGDAGILKCVLRGSNSKLIMKISNDAERINFVLDRLCELFPEARSLFIKGHVWSWAEHPYSKGAYMSLLKGQYELSKSFAVFRKRLLFIGDYTTRFPFWIEGALLSAHSGLDEFFRRIKQ